LLWLIIAEGDKQNDSVKEEPVLSQNNPSLTPSNVEYAAIVKSIPASNNNVQR
jgi:hypothetical protein